MSEEQIIQYTGKGEHPGTFDFNAQQVQALLEDMVAEIKNALSSPAKMGEYYIYSDLLDEMIALTQSRYRILEMDANPRMDYLVAHMIDHLEGVVYCATCDEEYPFAQISKGTIVDPSDDYSPLNGRTYTCPQEHEVLFVKDVITIARQTQDKNDD